ncbi:hypothetical protein ENSA5_42720 [Enhygromyxa salina]|uniref:Uncharacterized protein n=1 Tax=Enhygromyxa salina TaxID=215803 RepID=A0A2S9XKI9_9BACT|nr:hypothetical protein ENSA5_42720 [Enhygromyxa salina]
MIVAAGYSSAGFGPGFTVPGGMFQYFDRQLAQDEGSGASLVSSGLRGVQRWPHRSHVYTVT